jgi:hypothetical protein
MPHQDGAGSDLPSCIHNMSKVWQTMVEACPDNKCWIYVKPSQQSRHGCGAFQALHAHSLGANHMNDMASIAEAKLTCAKCHGEQ